MKRILLLVALALVALAPAQAQNKSLTPVPKIQFLDTSGDPLAGGKVNTFISGTSTPQATYTDVGGGTPNANPVILDSGGFAEIWLTVGETYTIRLDNSADVVQWTVDGVTSGTLDTNLVVGTTAVTFSATPTFDSSTSVYFSMALTGNVTSSTLSNAADGRVAYFNLCQDATGGRTFVWPSSVLSGPTIDPTASACTSAIFTYDGTNWREQAPQRTPGKRDGTFIVDGSKYSTIAEAQTDCPSTGCSVYVPYALTIPAFTITKPMRIEFGPENFTVSGTILIQNVTGIKWYGAGSGTSTSQITRF
ncbi:hypothetical protein LCGC14_2894600, partial [marine sediment metagenome]